MAEISTIGLDLAKTVFQVHTADASGAVLLELLAERGIETSYETVRRWVLKFGPAFATCVGYGKADRHVALGRDGGRDPGQAYVPVASRR